VSAGDVSLGLLGAEFVLPRAGMRLTWADTEITNEQRTADGTLVSDLRAVKRHWEIPFDPLILGSDLDAFITLYDLHADLSLLVANEDTTISAYTVKLRPLSVARELVREIWLWSGAKIVLDEI
jgi:hypothetical protein